jgi:short-subunit dehydrogenase
MSLELAAARHVLVTGAAGAIGGALARALASAAPRARLTLTDKDEAGARACAVAVGSRARAVVWDLARPEDVPAAYRDATDGGQSPVDVLVNCAGIMELRTFAGTSWELGGDLLSIDLLSPLRLMTLAIPAMRAAAAGVVVNLASLAGLLPIRGSSYYGAAKAGLAMASEVARIELAPFGVHVLTVYPGPIASGLERRARAQVRGNWMARNLPVGDAEALAARIVQALQKGSPRVVYPPLYVAAHEAIGLTRRITERLSPDPFE